MAAICLSRGLAHLWDGMRDGWLDLSFPFRYLPTVSRYKGLALSRNMIKIASE
jgi:hypothetical protein